MRVAIFGSAFNPPTKGHRDAVASLLEVERSFDEVLLIPSYTHAFGKSMLDYDLRIEMLKTFVDDLAIEKVKAFPIEHKLAKNDLPVYTYDLLEHLQAHYFPKDQLSFAIGPDNQLNWDKFYKADEIKAQWSLTVVPERQPIRSTLVRNCLQSGQSIEELVTPSVNRLIKEKGLYV
ncbi:MAG: nicotinate-nicotinamide nucleotide adenylyltransferase [Bacteroidota bacterium]